MVFERFVRNNERSGTCSAEKDDRGAHAQIPNVRRKRRVYDAQVEGKVIVNRSESAVQTAVRFDRCRPFDTKRTVERFCQFSCSRRRTGRLVSPESARTHVLKRRPRGYAQPETGQTWKRGRANSGLAAAKGSDTGGENSIGAPTALGAAL